MLPHCATASRMCRSLSLIRRPIRSFQRMVRPLAKSANQMQDNSTFQLRRKWARCKRGLDGRLHRQNSGGKHDHAAVFADDGCGCLLRSCRNAGVGAVLSPATDQDHRRPARRRAARPPGARPRGQTVGKPQADSRRGEPRRAPAAISRPNSSPDPLPTATHCWSRSTRR